MIGRRSTLLAAAILAGLLVPATGRTQTVGLMINDPGVAPGYTFFSPQSNGTMYLIDNNGELVHSWPGAGSTSGGYYLMPNGDIVHGIDLHDPWFAVPGRGGRLQRRDWDNNVVWQFDYSDSTHCPHHDVEALPNGNILAIAFEYKDAAEAIAAGRNPGLLVNGDLFPDTILEFQPIGADSAVIVWEWHVWDHLVQDFDSTKANYGVVSDHPELVDINYVAGGNGNHDWNHSNAVDYHANFDQIVLSVNSFSEWWIIDHSTTTAEAAGHSGGNRGKGGDILYRWGNPEAYGRGTTADRHDYRQHNVHWIEEGLTGAGRIMIFNNGNGRPVASPYSSFEEIVTPVGPGGSYGEPAPGQPWGPDTAAVILTSTPPDSIYSQNTSGAHRLPNGNTMVCEGVAGTFWELTPSGTTVWKYVCPVNGAGPIVQNTIPTGNNCFRCTKYPPGYGAFEGRDLTPQGVIELPPVGATVAVAEARFDLSQNRPNPFRPSTTIPFSLSASSRVTLDVYDVAGRHIETLVSGRMEPGAHEATWQPGGRAAGVYHYRLRVDGRTESRRMVLLR